ncbi:myoneurin-like [Aricia agestis]|uniref:myoneurin-like n=1 Tax=Aricia agestis TaxID=91739 RepID=UPI001C2024CA|nr:myoneurin-like [Aricia agestis]
MQGSIEVDLTMCRICLAKKKSLCPLFKYKLSGNYAEMLTAIADVKVASNDGLPEKICTKCCVSLEKAFLLKTIAERSDKKMRKLIAQVKCSVPTKKISFDSFTDIKEEIAPLAVKMEPKWEMEIDLEGNAAKGKIETIDGQDIVIANTVIRKVDQAGDSTSLKQNDYGDADFFDDDLYHNDDDNDEDYVPDKEVMSKIKFKKPKLTNIKVFKAKKPVKKTKANNKVKEELLASDVDISSGEVPTRIACYPILKNGAKGAPIYLKRPKDATIVKVHNYKPPARDGSRIKKHVPKEREKLVCPVCGILTYTLGNHIATHEEKKKFTCPECPRTFAQKNNLAIHLKKHSGIKDHICDVCGAGFYTQKSLARHNLIHKGERPYPCNLCSKTFIARCDLGRHLRIHAGYKPYKCATCAMSFNAKHQLQNHERMHTGERPYTCQVCDLAFSYKVNLNNHVFKIHGINLKFKSIHTVTEEVLRREMNMVNEARDAIAHIMPQLGQVPAPAAHETVHHSGNYSV